MSAIEPTMPADDLRRQIPAFAAIGAFGFAVDSAITYALVRGLAVDPYLARLPAFAVATVVNFALNRRLTFSGSQAPLLQAFWRYCVVCAAGLAVNWIAYSLALKLALRLGFAVTPELLPLFIAFGAGVAMFVTFFGYRRFAFRA